MTPQSPLEMTDDEVVELSEGERRDRLVALETQSHSLVDQGIAEMVHADGREVAGIVVLFSGGNDSTVLAHLFKDRATHAAHANTTVGIEETRQFVRDTCAAWGLPLIERTPPNPADHYRALVLAQGFPGPGHHYKMFQRLKERSLRQVRKELVRNPRKERVVFLAGRRRQESQRRANIAEFDRQGSIVYVSPLVNWTKPDMTLYRTLNDVPRNEVSDLIHMSGECLCGSFAHKGERSEIELWFPHAFELISELEEEIADRADLAQHVKTWGWGGNPATLKMSRTRPSKKTGMLCSSCEYRTEPSGERIRIVRRVPQR